MRDPAVWMILYCENMSEAQSQTRQPLKEINKLRAR